MKYDKFIPPFRLINTGLLPRVINQKLTHVEYATGASFDSAAVGSYLVTIEQPTGTYKFLGAYVDMLCAFHEVCESLLIILRKAVEHFAKYAANRFCETGSMCECVLYSYEMHYYASRGTL